MPVQLFREGRVLTVECRDVSHEPRTAEVATFQETLFADDSRANVVLQDAIRTTRDGTELVKHQQRHVEIGRGSDGRIARDRRRSVIDCLLSDDRSLARTWSGSPGVPTGIGPGRVEGGKGMIGTPKLLCTGRGSHKPRTVGRYTLLDDEPGFVFAIQVRRARDSDVDRGVFEMPWVHRAGPPVHLRCPTCRRDMRFKVTDFDRFLRADTGRRNRDVSLLAASLL